MKEIGNFGIWVNGLCPSICSVITDWNPGVLRSEREYRDSLFSSLKICLPTARIETEYRDVGTTIDIYLSWEGVFSTEAVYFELKFNLLKKTDYDRLVGQIVSLEPNKRNIFIILCGKTDTHLAEQRLYLLSQQRR